MAKLRYINGKPLNSKPIKIKEVKEVSREKAEELGKAILPKLRRNANERIASVKAMKDEYIG